MERDLAETGVRLPERKLRLESSSLGDAFVETIETGGSNEPLAMACMRSKCRTVAKLCSLKFFMVDT